MVYILTNWLIVGWDLVNSQLIYQLRCMVADKAFSSPALKKRSIATCKLTCLTDNYSDTWHMTDFQQTVDRYTTDSWLIHYWQLSDIPWTHYWYSIKMHVYEISTSPWLKVGRYITDLDVDGLSTYYRPIIDCECRLILYISQLSTDSRLM